MGDELGLRPDANYLSIPGVFAEVHRQEIIDGGGDPVQVGVYIDKNADLVLVDALDEEFHGYIILTKYRNVTVMALGVGHCRARNVGRMCSMATL